MQFSGYKRFPIPTAVYRWAAFVALAALLGCGRSAPSGAASATPPQRAPTAEVRVLKPRPADDAALTPEQAALKRRLELQLASEHPTHRLTLGNHRVVEGQIVNETPTTIMLREEYGYSGSIISAYRRSEIIAIDGLRSNACEVTRQDIALYEQFPNFHFTKVPPYSIVSDAPYADVEKAVRSLTQLREQFEHHFAALIRPNHAPQNIQIVFFSTEEPFRAYARKVAPPFVASAGFYSATENRLVLLNQLGTAEFVDVQDRLTQRRRELESRPDIDPADRHLASTRLATVKSEMTYEAKAMTERLIRHEGAHQLVSAYGIQSRYGIEPTWLSEGLAQYCEPSDIGAYHRGLAERLIKARDANRLLPLRTVLNHRDPAGFFTLGAPGIETAYAESWAMTFFLMQDRHRAKFLDYIKSLRDIHTDAAAIAAYKAEPETLLLRALGIDSNTLETQWQQYVTRL